MGCRRSLSARRSRSRSAPRGGGGGGSPRRSSRPRSRRRTPQRSPPRRSPLRRSSRPRSPLRRSSRPRSPPRRRNSRPRSPPRRSPPRRSPLRRSPPRRSPPRHRSSSRQRSQRRSPRGGRSPSHRGSPKRSASQAADVKGTPPPPSAGTGNEGSGSGLLTADVLAEAAKRAAFARANAIKTLHASRDRACVFFLQGHCKLYGKCTNFHPQDEAEKQRWLDDYFATKCMLGDRCTTAACLYNHPGQTRGQPPPGGTIEDAEQQDVQYKVEKAQRDKLKNAQDTAMNKSKTGSENRGQLHEAAVSAAAKLGLNRPPPPPPEPLAPGPVPGSAAPPSPTKSSAPRNSDDPMEAEIQRMMQLQQQEYQAKQIVKESATAKAGPIGPGPSDKSQASQGFRAMSFFGLSKSLRLQLAKHGVFLWRE